MGMDPKNTSADLAPEPLAVPPRIAAQMLSVSEPTLRKLPIPRVQIGPRGVRYVVADLRSWLAERSERSEGAR